MTRRECGALVLFLLLAPLLTLMLALLLLPVVLQLSPPEQLETPTT